MTQSRTAKADAVFSRAFLLATLAAGMVMAMATASTLATSTTGTVAAIALVSLVTIAAARGRLVRSAIAAILGLSSTVPEHPTVAGVERCEIRQSDPDAAGHARPRAPGSRPTVVRERLH
ncbi:MAG: DUF6412 domain-containing protein [Leifsonia sp.]